MSSEKDYSEIEEQFKTHVAEGEAFFEETFSRCEESEAFIAGDQWTTEAKRRAAMDKSDMPVVNLTAQHFDQVSGEQRQQDVSFSVVAAQLMASKEEKDKQAAHKGLLRSISYQSKLDRHLSRAMEQCYHGFGWLHGFTEENRENPFLTDIKVQSLPNYNSALLDPAFRTDWRECDYGIVVEPVGESKYRAKYANEHGDQAPPAFGDHVESDYFINRYYVREYVDRTYYQRQDGSVQMESADDDGNVIIPADFIDSMTKKVPVVVMYILINGNVIDEVVTPWDFIPVVPLPGRERRDGDSIYYEGIVARGMDPQRFFNKMIRAVEEIVDMAPKSPWVGPNKSFGTGAMRKAWQNAYRLRHAFLPHADGQPAPNRTDNGSNIGAVNQLMMQSMELINSAIGRYEPSMGQSGNQSGVAIGRLQQQGSTSTFYYKDATRQALEFMGELITNGVPRIYRENRVVSYVDARNKTKVFEINGAGSDISGINGGVHVVISRDWSSQTEELGALTGEAMKNYPEARPALLPLHLQSLNAPEIDDEIQKISKSLTPLDMLDDEDKQAKLEEMQQQPPPPEVQLEQAKIQREQQQGQLEIEREKVRLAIEQTRLKRVEIESGLQAQAKADAVQQERNQAQAGMIEQAKQIAMHNQGVARQQGDT